jgi:hypothetical protein
VQLNVVDTKRYQEYLDMKKSKADVGF